MRNGIIYLLLLMGTVVGYSQKSATREDYILLNTALIEIANLKAGDTLYFFDESLPFENQRKIFSKDFFIEYTHPAIGVDNKKIEKLIETLDFKYLAEQCRKNGRWDLGRIDINVIPYSEANITKFKGKKQYRVSRPVFTEDKQFAFIYSYYSCGYPDCGSNTLKIYKLENGSWVFFTQIPISVS